MKKENWPIAFTVIFLVSNLVFAQNTGKIAGKVTDSKSGEPVPGVNVVIQGTYLGGATDSKGELIIVNVPPGDYNVGASFIGYSNTLTTNVKVSAGYTTKLDVQISQSIISTNEIVVVAKAPMVIKDKTSTESKISADEIKTLPLQNLEQLITQQAGVSKDALGGIHIRGGRSSEISYLVNGVSITDDFDRTQALTIETESVQELQVISGTFNAEYGNAMSGVVNIITKSGGNKNNVNLESGTGKWSCLL